ncbi:MAG: hypothetical protein COV44_11685 [Deltaproteobacteria bacterium CG11_big_fil_rev_8_21_14_0_20_45_16]|nr:MAG: hypothetical protein COV44_11685 [Deltaproteobacteria bacterium CG11_big_fil_rev_8_21_14_0_20_45_16]
MKSVVALILIGLSLISCGNGKKTARDRINPLVEKMKIEGASSCEELNQIVVKSLLLHITKTLTDFPSIYESILNDMNEKSVEAATGNLSETEIRDYQDGQQRLFNELGAESITNCESIIRVEAFRQRILETRVYSNNVEEDWLDEYATRPDDKRIYWEFLQEFADHLDYFSAYSIPVSPIGGDFYSYGLRTDVDQLLRFRLDASDYPSVNVLATRDLIGTKADFQEEIPLHPGDRISAVCLSSKDFSRLKVEIAKDADNCISVKSAIESGHSEFLYITFEIGVFESFRVKYFRGEEIGEREASISGKERYVNEPIGPLVAAELRDDVIYIRLFEFEEGAAFEIARKISALKDAWRRKHSNHQLSIVLDLRFNGGGSQNEMQAIAGLFLPESKVGQIRIRDLPPNVKFKLEDFWVSNPGTIFEEPLTVLANNYSASASDILTQILKETGRATFVGEQTFGKGIGQVMFSIGEHLGGVFKFTALQFYGPRGESAQLVGVVPHIEVKDSILMKWREACQKIGRNAKLDPDTGLQDQAELCMASSMKKHYEAQGGDPDMEISEDSLRSGIFYPTSLPESLWAKIGDASSSEPDLIDDIVEKAKIHEAERTKSSNIEVDMAFAVAREIGFKELLVEAVETKEEPKAAHDDSQVKTTSDENPEPLQDSRPQRILPSGGSSDSISTGF